MLCVLFASCALAPWSLHLRGCCEGGQFARAEADVIRVGELLEMYLL